MVEGAFVDGIENVDGVVEDCAVLVDAVNSPRHTDAFSGERSQPTIIIFDSGSRILLSCTNRIFQRIRN
jgi:hypothetical protein